MVHYFFVFLTLTVLIELPVLFIVVRRVMRIPASLVTTWRTVSCALVTSCLTYPYLWFVLPAFVPNETVCNLVGEPLIVIVEGLVMAVWLPLSVKRALLVSLLCNAASIIVGVALMAFLQSAM